MRLLSSLLFIAIIINNIVIKSRITAYCIWENYISVQDWEKKIIFDPLGRQNLSGQLTILELTFF